MKVFRRLTPLAIALAVGATAKVQKPASAQIPAFLPNEQQVAPAQPMDIDGDWLITPLNKRIRIDRGRAYALDSWLHAFVLEVQPQMIVMQNITEVGPGRYEADDLPTMSQSTLSLKDSGHLEVTLPGLLGPTRFDLTPIATVGNSPVNNEPVDNDDLPVTIVAAAMSAEVSQDVPEPVYLEAVDETQLKVAMFLEASPEPGPSDVATEDSPASLPEEDFISDKTPDFLSYEAHTGCDTGAKSVAPLEDPRARIETAARIDKITQRTFASFSLDEIESGSLGDDMDGLCWYRLDGVWRQNKNLTLDRSEDAPEIWGTSSPELIVLANGNYTTARHLFVGSTGKDDEELFVTDGLAGEAFTRFVSDDGLSLQDVLKREGPIKRYRAVGATSLGSSLEVDVTRSGRIRLRVGDTTFMRPQPRASRAKMGAQGADDDVFAVPYNLQNLAASRRGYDAIKQDPFYLLQNPKLEVFARNAANEYAIDEQKTVPLGLLLKQEVSQGMVYNKSIVSSGREFQTTFSFSLGLSSKAKIPEGAKASASSEFAYNQINSLEENKTVGQTIGYSRAKQYALVLDYPFMNLSDDFLDAVEDARRHGRYDDIIRKFGTHYPYAVTYGAAAKMTQSITEESYRKVAEVNANYKQQASAEVFGNGGGYKASIGGGLRTGESGSIGEEGMTFVAVGGNGSWNENGYSLGPTPYPILLDLRSLDELLNPINFPEQPEVYTTVRQKLAETLEAYYSKHTDTLSHESLLPIVPLKKEEPIETWHIYVKRAWCTGRNDLIVDSATGTLTVDAFINNRGNRYATTKAKTITAKCKNKKEVKTYNYKSTTPGLLKIKGTRAQIAAYTIDYDMDWRYKPSNKNKRRQHSRTFKKPGALKNGLSPGSKKDYTWKIGAKGLPQLILEVRMRRVE